MARKRVRKTGPHGQKLYKMRSQKVHPRKGYEGVSFSLSVPTDIARQVPDGTLFTVEATDDGILYRVHRDKKPPNWFK